MSEQVKRSSRPLRYYASWALYWLAAIPMPEFLEDRLLNLSSNIQGETKHGPWRGQYGCEQCGCASRDFEMVIIPNTLWLSIARAEEFICAECIEQRLERPLEPSDFPDCLVMCYNEKLLNVREIPVNLWFFAKRGWFKDV